ncbi:ABATE domain-containing protein [Bosea sp. LjRoot90]|uniref:CGNR zinc finger domain-containing protein n=1 Tax=Bosea sp. LjRoot90 TaxID=3342342 RepID=UPI003ECE7AC3
MEATEFRFVGGRSSLDLIATLGKRHVKPIERLADSAAAEAWLELAGVLPRGSGARVSIVQLGALRKLRETIYRLVRAAMTGTRFEPSDLAALNAAATAPDLIPQLNGHGAETVKWNSRDPVDAATSSIARDAVLLLARVSAKRIKECEGPDCSLLFLDESQSSRRRWCSMDRCGNLSKIHTYRRRKPQG